VSFTYEATGNSKAWGYRLYLNPVFGQNLKFQGSSTASQMLEKDSLKKLNLIIAALLKSSDPETQMMAARTLANMMFVPIGKTETPSNSLYKIIHSTCTGPLLSIAEREIDTSSLCFKISNQSKTNKFPSVMASNLVLKRSDLQFGKRIYFEVRLETNGLIHVGWISRLCMFSKPEQGIGQNETSFGFTSNGELCWSDKRQQETEQLIEGDVIGCFLDLESCAIFFSLNGKKLSPLQNAFPDLNALDWDGDFFPAASLSHGEKVFFNLGQEVMSYEHPGFVTVLEACKGPLHDNATALDKGNFKLVSWSKYNCEDTETVSSGWKAITASEKLLQSEQDATVEFAQLQTNLLRQVARSLSALELDKVPAIFDLGVQLANSDDHPTREWALRALKEAGKSNPEVASRLLEEKALLTLAKGCMGVYPSIGFEDLVSAFCEESNLVVFRNAAISYLSPKSGESIKDQIVYESDHPYELHGKQYFNLSLPGVKVMKVMFDPRSKIASGDWVKFFREDPSTNPQVLEEDLEVWGKTYTESFPLSDKPLYIPADHATVLFQGNSSLDAVIDSWGWKLLVVPAEDGEFTPKLSLYEQHKNDPQNLIFESKHPYDNNADVVETIYMLGAKGVAIAFDPRSSTELNYDYLQFYSKDPRSDSSAEALCGKLTGGMNNSSKQFPGLESMERDPLILVGEQFFYRFVSDGSNNDWGYRFVAWPLDKIDDPLEVLLSNADAKVFESEHPYKPNTDTHELISFPGARSIKIAFDPRSSTEFDCDMVRIHRFFEPKKESDGDVPVFQKFWGAPKYHGKRSSSQSNFPTIDNPLIVLDNQCYISFNTSSSSPEWGWRLVAWPSYEIIPLPFDIACLDPNHQLVESPHPYPKDFCEVYPIKIQSTMAISILFFHETSTCSADLVEIYKQNPEGKEEAELEQMEKWAVLSGGFDGTESNFPGLCGISPMMILASEFFVRFKSASTGESESDWGFKMVAYPDKDPLQEWGGNASKMVESPHNYPDNFNQDYEISFPGAAGIEICFDPNSSTEKDYDFICFYSGTAENKGLKVKGTQDKYSGRKGPMNNNFPTIEFPLLLPHPSVVLHFQSDGSNNDWGWRVCARPVDKLPEDPFAQLEEEAVRDANLKLIRLFLVKALFALTIPNELRNSSPFKFSTPRNSSNFYPANCLLIRSASFPGADAVDIKFSKKCQTEYDEDILSFHSDLKAGENSIIEVLTSNGTKKKASFSGAYSLTEIEDGAPEIRSSGWPDCSILTSSFVWKFQSSAVKSFYGVDFSAQARYPRVNTTFEKSCPLLLIQNVLVVLIQLAIAPVLKKNDSMSLSIQNFAGLVLTNLLFIPGGISEFGVEWLKTLLKEGPEEGKLLAIRSLVMTQKYSQATSGPESKDQTFDTDSLVHFIVENSMLEQFVLLTLSDNFELQLVALEVLQKCLDAKQADLEAVLLKCIADQGPSVQKQALDRIAEVATRAEGREKLLKLGAIGTIQNFLLPDPEQRERYADYEDLVRLATSTIQNLLVTEEAAMQFMQTDTKLCTDTSGRLRTETGGAVDFTEELETSKNTGGAVLLKMLQTTDTKIKSKALSIMNSLLTKRPLDSRNKQACLKFEEDGSCFLFKSSIAVNKTSPIYCYEIPEPKVETKDAASQPNSDFSFAFWAYMDGMPSGDGFPVFYKGKEVYHIFNQANSSNSFRTVSADCKLRTGKVYYEVIIHTPGCFQIGWASDQFSCNNNWNAGIGDDRNSYAVDFYRKAKWWGGSTDYGTENWGAGDVVGICIDFDSGIIQASLNGELAGPAFTEQEHGPKAEGEYKGPFWRGEKGGFYPALSLSASQSCTFNFGNQDLMYLPEGYKSVFDSRSDQSKAIQLRYYNANKSCWLPITGSPEPLLVAEGGEGQSMYISSTLRFCFNTPVQKSSEDKSTSPKATLITSGDGIIVPYCWTHFCFSYTGYPQYGYGYYTLYINGSYVTQVQCPVVDTNNFRINIGQADAPFKTSENGTLWIENFKWFANGNGANCCYDLFQTKPAHLQIKDNLLTAVQTQLSEISKGLLSSDPGTYCPTLMFLSLSGQTQASSLFGSLSEETCSEICEILLSKLKSGSTSEELYNTLASMSSQDSFRVEMIKRDYLRALIALTSDEYYQWAELVLCNLHISDPVPQELSHYYFFHSNQFPFTSKENLKEGLSKIPLASFLMANDVDLFVKIALSVQQMLHTIETNPDQQLDWPQEQIDVLFHWSVDLFLLLSLDVEGNTEINVVETKKHPYDNNDFYRGELHFPGAVSLKITWDPQTSTENGYDYLFLFTDPNNSEKKIKSPREDDKWTGTSSDCWPAVTVSGTNYIGWEWRSDGSNNDWGFKMFISGVYISLGNAKLIREKVVLAGGMEPLLSFCKTTDKKIGRVALVAVTNFCYDSRARKLVDAANWFEPLIQTLKMERYQVSDTRVAIRETSSTDGVPIGEVLQGAIILVDKKEWFYQNDPDPTHLHPAGNYHLHIVDPPELQGWIPETGLVTLSADSDTLRLVCLMCMDKSNRKKLIESGKMQIILQMSSLNDETCKRVTALCLEDMAFDSYSWAVATSAMDLELISDGSDMSFFFSDTLEAKPLHDYLKVCLPMYSGEAQVGMKVTRGPHWDGAEEDGGDGNTGNIVRIDQYAASQVIVVWNNQTEERCYAYAPRSDPPKLQVIPIQSENKKILSFLTRNMEVYVDKSFTFGFLPSDKLELRILQRLNMTTPDVTLKSGMKYQELNRAFSIKSNEFYIQVVVPYEFSTLQNSTLKLHILPKFDEGEIFPMTDYHSLAFELLISLMKSNDLETRKASISALGKLGKPSVAENGSPQMSNYLDDIVQRKGLFGLIDATKSPISEISSVASEALNDLIPDMNSLLHLLTLIESNSTYLGNKDVSAWSCFNFFRLLYLRHRPTPLNSHTIDLVRAAKAEQFLTSLHLPLACNLNIKIVSTCDFTEKDHLEIFKTADRLTPSISYPDKQAIMSSQQKSACYLDNKDEMFVKFKFTPPAEGFTKLTLEVVAEYPSIEIVVNQNGFDSVGFGSFLEEDQTIGLLEFSFAKEIEVVFDQNLCILMSGERLAFYCSKELSENNLVRSFTGSKWESRFSYDGSALYFKHENKNENSTSSFLFRSRPVYRVVTDKKEKAEYIVHSNMQRLFENKSEKSGTVDRISFLSKIIISHDDIISQRWAAMAFTQLALHTSPLEGKTTGREYLYVNGNGLEVAYKMADHADIVITRLGCICLAQFITQKDAVSSVLQSLYWRPLLKACKFFRSTSTVELDACRHATWTLSHLLSKASVSDDLPVSEVMPHLVSCINSSDRLISSNAADALFGLVNRINVQSELLLQGGLNFLFAAATAKTPVTGALPAQEDVRGLELQQKAAKVLCYLISKIKSDAVLKIFLDNNICTAISNTFLSVKDDINMHDKSDVSDRVQNVTNAFSKISTFMTPNSSILSSINENHLGAFIRMIECAGTMVSPAYVFDELTPKPTLERWELEIGGVTKAKVRQSLILALLGFMEACPQFVAPSVKSLLRIAKACWKTDGCKIMTHLIQKTSENDKFVLELASNKLEFGAVISLTLGIFNFSRNITYASTTSSILDFLRKLCVNTDGCVSDNQAIIFQELTGQMKVGSKVKGCAQFDFQKNSDGFLEISSILETGKVWRSLEMFYSFEPREEILMFLDSTFGLWAALCSKNNVLCVNHFRSLLSFEEIMKALLWRNDKQKSNRLHCTCHLFCDLMVALYVDTNPAFMKNKILLRKTLSTDLKNGKCSQVVCNDFTYTELTNAQHEGLKLYVNDFVKGGRMLSTVSSFCPCIVDLEESLLSLKPQDVKYSLSCLNLIMHMVGYGFYSTFWELQELSNALITCFKNSMSFTHGSANKGLCSQKVKILQIVDLILDLKINLSLNETVDVYYSLMAQGCDLSAQSLGPAMYHFLCTETQETELELSKGMVVIRGSGWKGGDEDGSCNEGYNSGIVLSLKSDGVCVLWNNPNYTSLNFPTRAANIFTYQPSELAVLRFPMLRSMLKIQDRKAFKVNYGEDLLAKNDSVLLEAVNGPLDLALLASRLLIKSHTDLYQIGTMSSRLSILAPDSLETCDYLQDLIEQISSVSIGDLSDVTKRLKFERCLKIITALLKNEIASRKVIELDLNVSVVRGPDWLKGDEDGGLDSSGEPKVGFITAYDAYNSSYTVQWNETGGQSFSCCFAPSQYDIVLFSKEHSFVAQYTAYSLGLHTKLIHFLSDCSGDLSEHADVLGALKLVFSTLLAMCVGNDNVSASLCSFDYLPLLCVYLQNDLALPVLQTIFNSTGSYEKAGLPFVKTLITLVKENIKSGASLSAAKNYVDLLLCMLQRAMNLSTAALNGNQQIQLFDTKNLIASVLLSPNNNDSGGAVLEILNLVDFKSPLDNEKHAELVKSLVSLLGCCFTDNPPLQSKLLGSPGVDLKTIVFNIDRLRQKYFGYVPRARNVKPWVQLLNHLYMSEIGVSLLRSIFQKYQEKEKSKIGSSPASERFSQVFHELRNNLASDLIRYKVEPIRYVAVPDVIFESEHCYRSGIDYFWEVQIPDAKRIKVAFSNETSLFFNETSAQEDQDYVQFYHEWPVDADGYWYMKVIGPKKGALVRKSASLESEQVGPVPVGTCLKIRSKTWFSSDNCPDPDRSDWGGYYRVEIVEPTKYAGYASWKKSILKPVDLEWEDLRTWSPQYFGTCFPGINNSSPLIILGQSFMVHFHTSSKDVSWGYRMAVQKCEDSEFLDVEPKLSLYEKTINSLLNTAQLKIEQEEGESVIKYLTDKKNQPYEKLKIVESSHPYESDKTMFFSVTIASDSGLEIIFDDLSKTEEGNGLISFWKDEAKTEQVSGQSYSGTSWPGVGDNTPLFIPNTTIVWVSFDVDRKSTEWGFRFLVQEAFPPPSEWEKMVQDGIAKCSTRPFLSDGVFVKDYQVIAETVNCWQQPDDTSDPVGTLSQNDFVKVSFRKIIEETVWLLLSSGHNAKPLNQSILTEEVWVKEFEPDSGTPYLAWAVPQEELIEVDIPGAECYAVAFSTDSRIADSVDYIEIVSSEYKSGMPSKKSMKFVLSSRYSGYFRTEDGRTSYPSLQSPLIVPASKFKIKHSYRSSGRFGFSIAAKKVPLQADSLHPYRVGSYLEVEDMTSEEEKWYQIQVEDASQIAVAFSASSQIEENKAYVRFCQSQDRDKLREYWGEIKYFGTEDAESNLPGVDGREALVIPSNNVWMYFKNVSGEQSSWKVIACDYELLEKKLSTKKSTPLESGQLAKLEPLFPFF